MLMAAVLHDTIEDTNTDFDDVKEAFGPQVAEWVSLLSKDKRKVDIIREKEYMTALAEAPWQVQVCKLADVFDNLMDRIHTAPEQQIRTLERSQEYLDALKTNLKPEADPPIESSRSCSLNSEPAFPAARGHDGLARIPGRRP